MTDTLHQRLRAAADALTHEPVALSHLADAHGHGTRGALLVLLSAPGVLPLPGVGNVLGIGLLVLAWAIWRGQPGHQLPARVAGWQLSAPSARRVLGLLAGVYATAGRWLRARLPHLVDELADGTPRWLAPKVGMMGGLIFLPIPFGNVLPAVALSLLGLGLLFRDGLAVLLALLAGSVAVAYTAGLGVLAWHWGLDPLLQWLQRGW
ncbi:MAG TPA: exopolysaccharide biosynthesis protein [Aquabacterium sp.]|nr:exopolysaccharide biosynthesis protein [Aquabacterium sp.]